VVDNTTLADAVAQGKELSSDSPTQPARARGQGAKTNRKAS
jgi:hypothetical protein